MPNNVLNPKNLRWLTVYLFLGLMVLLLALNLFVPSNSGKAANNLTPTPTSQSSSVIICKNVLGVSCKQAEHIIGTANANTATAAKATTTAAKATAAAKASATAATATAVITATANANATATAKATP